MTNFAAMLVPIALLLPAATANEHARLTPESEQLGAPAGMDLERQQAFETFFDAYRPQTPHQVRVSSQRVVIRITTLRPQESRQNLSAELQRAPVQAHLEERKMGKCVQVQSIAGVEPGPENRLILHMRDRSMVSAALDKECSAREFYLGFYVERQDDGKLCVKRDKLQSRAGASCKLNQLRRLVVVRD